MFCSFLICYTHKGQCGQIITFIFLHHFFFFFFLTSYNKENDFSSFNGTSRGRAKQKLCNFRRFNERRNRSGCCDDKNFQLLNKIWVPWFSIKIYTRMVTKNMVHQLSKYEMFQHEQTTIRA